MNKVESEEGAMEEEVEEANREKEEEEEDPKTREEVNPVAKIAGENFQKVFLLATEQTSCQYSENFTSGCNFFVTQ